VETQVDTSRKYCIWIQLVHFSEARKMNYFRRNTHCSIIILERKTMIAKVSLVDNIENLQEKQDVSESTNKDSATIRRFLFIPDRVKWLQHTTWHGRRAEQRENNVATVGFCRPKRQNLHGNLPLIQESSRGLLVSSTSPGGISLNMPGAKAVCSSCLNPDS
jgi:hypothetical protein